MRIISLVSVILLLGACEKLGLGEEKQQAASALDGYVENGMEVGSGTAFKGKQMLVVGGFSVGFIDSKEVPYAGKKGLLGKRDKELASAHVMLKQVDNALKQQIVDAAYLNFIDRLKAEGYIVADRNKLLRDADFVRVSGKTSPQHKQLKLGTMPADITLVAPTSIGLVYDPNATGFENPITAAIDFAGRKGTPVLFVQYVVDFARTNSADQWWKSEDPLQVVQRLSLAEGGGVWLIGGHAGAGVKRNGYVKLAEPVTSSEEYAAVNDLSGGKKELDAAQFVTTMLHGSEAEDREFEVEADPVPYNLISSMLLAEANYKIIGQMAQLR